MSAGLVLLITTAVWWAVFRPQPELTPTGRYGVALDTTWLAFATNPGHRAYLGDPIWKQPFEGRDCVGFEFYLVCHNPHKHVRGTLEEYELVDLGRRLLPSGLTPTPTRPDRVVQAYLDRLDQAGVPWRYWLGSPISGPLCVSGGPGSVTECVQFFTRQELRWWEGVAETDPDSVRLTALGLQLQRPQ